MPMPNFLNPMTVQPASGPYAQQAESERLMGLAQALMQQPQQAGPSGWANIAQAVLQPFVASQFARKGEAKMDESMREQARLAEQSKRLVREEERKYEQWTKEQLRKERELAADQYKLTGPARLSFVQSGAVPKELLEGKKYTMEGGFRFDPTTGEATPIPGYAQTQAAIQAAGRAPAGPSEIERKIALAQQLGATPEEIRAMVVGSGAGNGRGTPEQRETAKLEAGALKEAQEKALAARKTLETIARLEEMQQKGVSTGPLDQYLPGQNRQLYNSLASDLNLSTLRQNFGGNPTEGERAANLETLPSTGKYENVNAQLLAKIRADAEQKIAEFEQQRGGTSLLPVQGAPQASPGASQQAAPAAEPVAVNPQTGEKIVYRNGQWVPL